MKEKVIVFGASNLGFLTYTNLKENMEIINFCDNDFKKWGKEFFGLQVVSPEEILNIKYDKLIIASMYYKQIQYKLVYLKLEKLFYVVDEKFSVKHSFFTNIRIEECDISYVNKFLTDEFIYIQSSYFRNIGTSNFDVINYMIKSRNFDIIKEAYETENTEIIHGILEFIKIFVNIVDNNIKNEFLNFINDTFQKANLTFVDKAFMNYAKAIIVGKYEELPSGQVMVKF